MPRTKGWPDRMAFCLVYRENVGHYEAWYIDPQGTRSVAAGKTPIEAMDGLLKRLGEDAAEAPDLN